MKEYLFLRRQVTTEEGAQFLKEHDMHLFFETSVFDGTNVEKVKSVIVILVLGLCGFCKVSILEIYEK